MVYTYTWMTNVIGTYTFTLCLDSKLEDKRIEWKGKGNEKEG